MVKELERAGLPTAHICSIVPISRTVGANRIVLAVAIPHPLGDPEKSPEEEATIRRRLVEQALNAIATPLTDQHIFTDAAASSGRGASSH